jgi:hypothetical protein
MPVVFTVATPVFVLLHIPLVAGSVRGVIIVGQRVNRPDIVPAFGSGFTVTTTVAATVPQLIATV